MTIHLYPQRSIATCCTLILLLLLSAACGGETPTHVPSTIEPREPTPVIYDTDMAHEDMFAALYLLGHPNVEVKAITVAGTGEAHCAPGMTHALGLVALSGKPEVPVSCGSETPLAGDHEFPAEWRERADTAYGVDVPEGGQPADLDAPDLIAQVARETDEPLNIVAVGPLTNIAAALQEHPDIVSEIGMIYIMGGSVDAPGNVQGTPAEWNIYVDPAAANIVLNAGAPVTLVPLDATTDAPVTRGFYDTLGDNLDTPAAQLVHDLLRANLDFVGDPGFHFWDTLTAAISTDDGLATFEEMPIQVVEGDGPESGRTERTPDGPTIRVATSANRQAFEQLLLTVLNLRFPDTQ
jgi:pyrimidine-specific ribonucleoside hydrolase